MQFSKLKRIYKLGIFLLVAYLLSLVLIWVFEAKFNTEDWKADPLERYEMVDDLIESQFLMSKTRAEVIESLGDPDAILKTDKEAFLYTLGSPPSLFESEPERLLIIFNEDKVEEVTLATE